jgi:hypothetical protein
MKYTMVAMASWTAGFSRLLLALSTALVLAALAVPEVDATKAGKNTIDSVSKRAGNEAKICENAGGTATVTKKPGGTTVTCTDVPNQVPEGGDYACTFHSKGYRCHAIRTSPPGSGPVAPPADEASAYPTNPGLEREAVSQVIAAGESSGGISNAFLTGSGATIGGGAASTKEATAPVTEPIAESIAAPITAPVAEASDEAVAAPGEESRAAPVEEPIGEPVAGVGEEPATAPVEEAVAEPVTAPIDEVVETPATTPIHESVAPIAEDAAPTVEPMAAEETISTGVQP